jgi:uncharacterized membrane protein
VNSLPTFLPPVPFETVAWLAAAALAVLLVLRLVAGPPAAISRRVGLYVLRTALVATLLALLLNPVHVEELPGSMDPPDVFYLLDSSTSMAMGTSVSRWDEVTGMIRGAQNKAGDRSHARLNLFRFGQKLVAMEPSQIGLDQPAGPPARGPNASENKLKAPARPTDTDTQLAGGLRQLSSRFGRALPASIVLFSDGQARDASDVEKIASYFSKLAVPIHVVPVGDTAKGGDVAIVGVVAPDRVRRFSQVDMQVFLRSFGYEGCNTRLVLSSVSDDGKVDHEFTSTPITLRKGIQSVPLAFQSDPKMRKLRVSIKPQEDEISTDNNQFDNEISIDRTKIRVLYVEGNVTRLQQVRRGNQFEQRGSFSDLHDALSEDPDIECVVLMAFPGSTELRRIGNQGFAASDRGFPDTVAELSAFDCIIFSNVPQAAFSEKHLNWVENWVANRGGGFCMVGGQFSFSSGGWAGGIAEKMLPVELRTGAEDFESADQFLVQPTPAGAAHPLWHILSDEKQNRDVVRGFPAFAAANRFARAKPSLSTVLATAPRPPGEDLPVIAVGRYGKGRSMALAGGITEPWSGEFTRWGQNDHRYYAKFWRNAVYWLTESSSIGRRRLIASADKKFYRPGETISLAALAYDEGANRTRDYRIVAMIEPAVSSSDLSSDYSPVRWPDGLQRTGGEEGPYIAWGEEFELAKGAGKEGYDIQLPIGEGLSAATQALRVELTAYEDLTQVDSTSLNIQVLDDPFELQNPFPNHELLSRIAAVSGGKVLTDADALARELSGLPVKVGAPEVRKTPLWSQWPLLALLVGLLATEWIWRRSVGLA